MLSNSDVHSNPEKPVSGAFRIDPTRGRRDGTVNAQWATRPDDERFLSLTELSGFVRGRRDRSQELLATSKRLNITPGRQSGDLVIETDTCDAPLAPTHWGFGQIATLAGAPADYLRSLPAELVADNIRFGLSQRTNEEIKLYAEMTSEGGAALRSAT